VWRRGMGRRGLVDEVGCDAFPTLPAAEVEAIIEHNDKDQ
jgi:hypothetical protein